MTRRRWRPWVKNSWARVSICWPSSCSNRRHQLHPANLRLQQLMALALARCGATARARLILEGMLQRQTQSMSSPDGSDDGALQETLSMLARTYKDLALEAQTVAPEAAKRHWIRALELYLNAHTLREDYYPGINAASTALMLGRRERARSLALEVERVCLRSLDELDDARGDDAYWLNATLGEAAVILGKLGEARRWYSDAVAVGLEQGRLSDLGSTVRQLSLLAPHVGLENNAVNELCAVPRVAVFTGHMFDLPGREVPRLPESIVPLVKAEIKAWLDRENIGVGFASVACGADLLFHEAVLERGGIARVVLPFNPRDFRESSVTIGGLAWMQRFDRVMGHAIVQQLSDRPLESNLDFQHVNQVLHGLSIIHARQLASDVRYLAVWDGAAGNGPGGTADAIARWLRLARSIDVIPVPEVRPAGPLAVPGPAVADHSSSAARSTRATSGSHGTRVIALLFADVVGYSKLNEDQIPIFVAEFLGLVAELLDSADYPVESRNTWGDGLYLVFDDVRDAGLFALDMVRRVRETDWKARGLPEDLNLRTGLHAGPVYLCTDPVTRRPSCIGTHVSLTARIEPITPPGEVYASEPFAAMVLAQGVTEFHCRPVGHIPLAKSFGTFPMYHIAEMRPSGERRTL